MSSSLVRCPRCPQGIASIHRLRERVVTYCHDCGHEEERAPERSEVSRPIFEHKRRRRAPELPRNASPGQRRRARAMAQAATKKMWGGAKPPRYANAVKPLPSRTIDDLADRTDQARESYE